MELLEVRVGGVALDATVGFGGHARLLAERLGREGTLVGMDVDPGALAAARRNLMSCRCRVELVRGNFADARTCLGPLGIKRVDVLLADLGVNSWQLDDPDRGRSFRRDGPLDMRLDPSLKTTAADLVNRLKEKELADLLYFNAQEFATAVRYGLKVVTVIMNNNCWGSEKAYQRYAFNERYVGADTNNPRFDKYAELFGGTGFYVERPEDIGNAFLEALNVDGPSIIEIPTDPDEMPRPARLSDVQAPKA